MADFLDSETREATVLAAKKTLEIIIDMATHHFRILIHCILFIHILKMNSVYQGP